MDGETATLEGRANPPAPGLGRLIFGIGVLAVGAVNGALGDFDPGQPAPATLPDRAGLARAAAAFLVLAGGAVLWRRTASAAAAALTAYYAIVVVILMNGWRIAAHPGKYGAWSGAAEQLAVAAGALILHAAFAGGDRERAVRLVRAGQIAFGVCALAFGGAHFVYMNLTAPLVPRWLPPSQTFWGYATGVAQMASGLAILVRMQARAAAYGLTGMYLSFTLLVHGPMLLADPTRPFVLTENALNLVLVGVAWVVADSLPRRDGALHADSTGAAPPPAASQPRRP